MKFDIKKALPHFIAIIAIVGITIIFFLPQFEGKVLNQSDMVQVGGMQKELIDYNAKNEDTGLWSSMFGGMPAYQIYAENPYYIWDHIQAVFRLYVPYPAGMFILGGIMLYIGLLAMGISPYLSLLAALGLILSTNTFILLEAGHITKILTVLLSPIIVIGVYLIQQKKYLLGGILFALGMQMSLASNHPQMTYYLGLTMIPFVIFALVESIKNKDFIHLGKMAIVAVLGLGLAMGTNARNLLTTYEYGKDTMRGAPILTAKAGEEINTSKKSGDGLEYDYAMQWSNGAKDLLASIVPDAVGGGSGRWLDKNSYLAKQIGQRKDFQAPTYWGSLPFTSGPAYFGAVLVFLFLFFAIAIKGPFKWWMVSSVVLTLLISMGRHFPILNNALYEYLPLFNKFRAHSSILSVTVIFLPIFIAYGLQKMLSSSEKISFLKPLYISVGILGGICLALGVLGSALFSFEGTGDANYANIIEPLIIQRQKMLTSSSFRSLFFIFASAGLIWLFIRDKINKNILTGITILLIVIDLFSMGKLYLPSESFITSRKQTENIAPRPVDNQILADKELAYRVYDGTVDPYQSAILSYYHRSVGGYHPAKLQRYQDLITYHLGKGNMSVFNMMNTKYFISNGPDNTPIVQANPGALGAAWVVNRFKLVPDANAEIDSLTTFDPKTTAIVHKEFENDLAGISSADSSTIAITSFSLNKIEYEANMTSQGLGVFSEVWYGPNKGWQAYIDDKPVDHIRVNYVLRGLNIPQGTHKIKFEFKPSSYFMGGKIGYACSALLLIWLGYALWKLWRDKSSNSALV